MCSYLTCIKLTQIFGIKKDSILHTSFINGKCFSIHVIPFIVPAHGMVLMWKKAGTGQKLHKSNVTPHIFYIYTVLWCFDTPFTKIVCGVTL